MFAWPLLKDNLELCQCVFGAGEVEISPRCLPVNTIPSFNNAERRIFMSATLADDNVLITHFNIEANSIKDAITPESASDIGDRMIIVPQELNPQISNDMLKVFFKNLSKTRNVVVIVPSYHRASYWSDVANETISASNIYEGVQKLKRGHVGLVVLVNKYDGIDLPNDACRILVIDGLPDVRRRIDKIEQSILDGSDHVLSQIIQRIEQGMGRGIRSNEDYCVVFLMGKTLTNHLYTHNALAKFSPATRAQINLSESLAEQIRGKAVKDIAEVISYALQRDPGWLKASKSVLIGITYTTEDSVDEIAISQRKAFDAACIGNYGVAVGELQGIANKATDKKVRGWLKQQLAEYQHFINAVNSQQTLKSALNDNHLVIRPIAGIEYSKLMTPHRNQARLCTEYLNSYQDKNRLVIYINSLIDQLRFSEDTASMFEQAVKEIAGVIGFGAQRPDAEFGKGPDVLWEIGQLKYLIIECKNGSSGKAISKQYCDQVSGHMHWFEQKYDKSCVATPIIIHPASLIERNCSPHPDMRIMSRSKLEELKKALQDFAVAVANPQTNLDIPSTANLLMQHSFTGESFIQRYTQPHRVQ